MVKAPEEKWGKMGENSPFFPPFSPIFPCHGYIVGTFVGTVPATGAGYF